LRATRNLFAPVYARFRHCADKQECLTQKNFEYQPGSGETAVTYDRKDEEFSADFVLIAKRHLEPQEIPALPLSFPARSRLENSAAPGCTCPRGLFFHAVYRIQQKLGKAYREN
jgi:hypothetical protein